MGGPVSSCVTVMRENEFHLSKANRRPARSTLSFTIVGRTLSVRLLATARSAKPANTP